MVFELNSAGHPSVPQERIFNNEAKREDYWTQSIATGSWSFVEPAKGRCAALPSVVVFGRRQKGLELRESQSPYKAFFDTEKIDIEGKNLWFWSE